MSTRMSRKQDLHYLAHLPEHLFDLHSFSELYELVLDQNWYEACLELDPGRRIYVQSIELAILAFESGGESHIPRVIGLSVLESLARSLTTNLLPETLPAIAAIRGHEVALSYLELIGISSSEKTRAILLFADQCIFDGDYILANQLLRQALLALQKEEDKEFIDFYTNWAYESLAKIGAWDYVLQQLSLIKSHHRHQEILCGLVNIAIQRDDLIRTDKLITELWTILNQLDEYALQQSAANVGKILAKAGRCGLLVELLDKAGTEAARIAAEIVEMPKLDIGTECAKVLYEHINTLPDVAPESVRSTQEVGLRAQILAKLGRTFQWEHLLLQAEALVSRALTFEPELPDDYPDRESENYALKTWGILCNARALAYIGKANEVKELIRQAQLAISGIHGGQWQMRPLVEAARILIIVGAYSDACRLPLQISGNIWNRDFYLETGAASVAKELAAAGQFEYALGTLYVAGLPVIVENGDLLLETLRKIGDAMADSGQFERAIELANSIPRMGTHNHLFSVIAQDLAQAGKIKEAQKALDEVLRVVNDYDQRTLNEPDEILSLAMVRLTGREPSSKSSRSVLSLDDSPETRLRITIEQMRSSRYRQRPEQLSKMLKQAWFGIAKFEDVALQVDFMRDLAEIAAGATDRDMLGFIEQRLRTILENGRGGRFEINLDTSKHIRSTHTWLVSVLAAGDVEIGNVDQAFAWVDRIPDDPERSDRHSVLRGIASALIRAKQFDLALSVISQFKDDRRIMMDFHKHDAVNSSTPLYVDQYYDYSEAIWEFVAAWSPTKMHEEIVRFADSISPDHTRSMAYAAIALGLSMETDRKAEREEAITKALALADELSDNQSKALAFSKSVIALLDLGDSHRARETLDKMMQIADAKSIKSVARLLFWLDPFDALSLAMRVDRDDYRLEALKELAYNVQWVIENRRIEFERERDKWLEWHLDFLRMARNRGRELLSNSLRLLAPSLSNFLKGKMKSAVWSEVESAISVLLTKGIQ